MVNVQTDIHPTNQPVQYSIHNPIWPHTRNWLVVLGTSAITTTIQDFHNCGSAISFVDTHLWLTVANLQFYGSESILQLQLLHEYNSVCTTKDFQTSWYNIIYSFPEEI